MIVVLIVVIQLFLASCEDEVSRSKKEFQGTDDRPFTRNLGTFPDWKKFSSPVDLFKIDFHQHERDDSVTPADLALEAAHSVMPVEIKKNNELVQNPSLAPENNIQSSAQDDQQNAPPEDVNEELLFLDIVINQEKRAEVVQVVKDREKIWVAKDFVVALLLQKMNSFEEGQFFGDNFIRIPESYDPKVDLENFLLSLTIPPDDFSIQNLIGHTNTIEKTDSIFAFLWNYILGLHHDVTGKRAAINTHHRSILTTPKGYFSNTIKLDKDLVSPPQLVRLETSYTVDWPKWELLFTLGDSASDAPNWSTHVASAGIKIQKSTAFNQGTLTYPTVDLIPSLEKQGTAEIMLNNANFFKKDLPMGRFLLDDIKLPPGAHKGELIIRDENGVVSSVPFSYFADREMLKPGLQQFSYSLGILRQNYLTESFSYNGPFAALNHKIGVANFLTLGLHGQWSKEVTLGSIEPRFRVWSFGSTSFPLALSLREEGRGYGIGNESNINIFDASLRFKNIYFSPLYRAQGSKLKTGKDGIFMSSVSARINRDILRYTSIHYQLYTSSFATNSVLSLNQALPIFKNINIYGNINYNFSQNSFSCFALLSINFANRHSMGLTLDEQTKDGESSLKTTANYRYHSDPKLPDRYFVSTAVGYGQDLFSEGVFGYNNRFIEGTIGARATSAKQFGYNSTLGGALVIAKNKFFLTKPIENSFSIVHVPNRPGLKVYRDGGLFLGETKKDGYLLVSDLNPYQKATISFDTRELDPSIDTQDLEKTIVVYPGIKTAHHIVLSAKTIKHFVLRPQKNGEYLDFGTSLSLNETETFVGHDGSVYIELENTVSTISGSDKQKSCLINIDVPNSKDEEYLVDLGTIACQ